MNDTVAMARIIADKMKLSFDATKAQGKYKAAEMEPKPNRPRVTIQRPYFDVTTSQVVDRTTGIHAKIRKADFGKA